jgi:diacylglycerol kinase
MKIHALAAVLVVIMGITVDLTVVEWCLVLIAFGLVLGAELLNTAIENLVDLVHPGFDERAGKVKDIAAAAVLVCAIIAAIIGCIIFIPKLLTL